MKDTLPQYAVTTTNNEKFTGWEGAVLAALIYKRFGYDADADAAVAAYQRLMGSNVSKKDFLMLTAYAVPAVRAGVK